MNKNTFDQLLDACSYLSSSFPEGLVFIGGMAIYLHAVNTNGMEGLAETTHDAGLYISKADFIDLRELENVTSNRRLSKQHMVKKDFDFDIYVQRESSLPIPYETVVANSVCYDVFRVACLEHLLVLKMAAYLERKGSDKGDKDARDVLRIAMLARHQAHPFRAEEVLLYWGDRELEELKVLVKGPTAVLLAQGNVHQAKIYRKSLEDLVHTLSTWAPSEPSSPKLG